MKFHPDVHHRRSIRLKDFDYASARLYFVALCTKEKLAFFARPAHSGEKDAFALNEYGMIVERTWLDLTKHNSCVALDAYVVMPDHFHGIIALGKSAGNASNSGLEPDLHAGAGLEPGLNARAGLEPAPTIRLSEVIRQFKTFSARRINELRNSRGQPVWQRDYFEHIIRDDQELRAIREYIRTNPQNWKADQLENMPF